MHALLRFSVRVLALVVLLLSCWEAAQAEIQIQGVTPVDVTPSGFSLLWQTAVPATPRLAIYADAAGTMDITRQLEVIPFPLRGGAPELVDTYEQESNLLALRTRMQSLGLMKVQVRGGSPGTTYYYRVYAEGNGDSGQWPVGAPASVTTAARNTFVTSAHHLLLTIDHPDSKGWVVTAASNEVLVAASATVGDGAASNQAYVDLSNMFGLHGAHWTPSGVKQITVTVISGWNTTVVQDFQLTFLTDFAVALTYAIEIIPPGRPSITLVEPAQDVYTQGQTVLITWVDTTPGPNTRIALYYDTDHIGENGTLIASGLDASSETAAVSYLWDTAGIPDGVYYVYATLTDGSVSTTSYAPGALTIDRNGTDTDGDGMSDAWERHYFGSLNRDGAGDFDGDGSTDRAEYMHGTSPTLSDVRMSLRRGLNLVTFPIVFHPERTSASLLVELGAAALSISRLNMATHTLDTTTMAGAVPQGVVFPIRRGEGYYIDMAQDHDMYTAGATSHTGVDLDVGVNLVGFQVLREYNAFQLLQVLGDQDTVASIRHFNVDTGRYETAVYYNGQPVGVNFPIQRSAAYLISIKRAVRGFVLP